MSSAGEGSGVFELEVGMMFFKEGKYKWFGNFFESFEILDANPLKLLE